MTHKTSFILAVVTLAISILFSWAFFKQFPSKQKDNEIMVNVPLTATTTRMTLGTALLGSVNTILKHENDIGQTTLSEIEEIKKIVSRMENECLDRQVQDIPQGRP